MGDHQMGNKLSAIDKKRRRDGAKPPRSGAPHKDAPARAPRPSRGRVTDEVAIQFEYAAVGRNGGRKAELVAYGKARFAEKEGAKIYSVGDYWTPGDTKRGKVVFVVSPYGLAGHEIPAMIRIDLYLCPDHVGRRQDEVRADRHPRTRPAGRRDAPDELDGCTHWEGCHNVHPRCAAARQKRKTQD